MIRVQYSNTNLDGDLITSAETGTEEGHELETAVLLSLFTDQRTEVGDDVPDGHPNGWWAQSYFDDDDVWGSKLWQLFGSKATNGTLAKAREHCLEALDWMISDGVAERVEVETWWLENRQGYLGILVTVYRPENPAPEYVGPWSLYYGMG